MTLAETLVRDRTANYLVEGLMDQIRLAGELTYGALTLDDLLRAIIQRLENRL